jgi:hypothetical protein
VIYEATNKITGDVVAAFEAPSDARAGFRLRFEMRAVGWGSEIASNIRLIRAEDGAWPNIGTAQFHWLPKEQIPHG